MGEWDSNRLDATCDKSLLIIIISTTESKSTPQQIQIWRRGGWELDDEIKMYKEVLLPTNSFL